MDQALESARGNAILDRVALALPHPILLVEDSGRISDANPAAEAFFDMGLSFLQRTTVERLCGPNSSLASLVAQSRGAGTSINLYRVDLGAPRQMGERLVDIHASPMPDDPGVTIVMLQERTLADKFSRQLSHRGAVRSVSALSAMLAHEIKNPLSGIRGAAQLLDSSASDDDRVLTQLIRDETDRIVKLVDRFEMFSDDRAPQMEPVNIHSVLGHVRNLARSGFARHIRIVEDYDPSLPPMLGSRDQMIQVLINLVKNAAEAIGAHAQDGEIQLSTAYRTGVRMAVSGSTDRVRLPLEVCVRDNGPGIPEDIRPHLFDPFVTTKSSGNGLGLALVAKVVGEHGGIVECDSVPRRTVFRLMLPLQIARESGTGTEEA
ncbi:MAG: two-component sensor histidine kinase [Methylocystis sp.]|nr:two-component sensor histidine kinase [Methylocystis sp.]MCA3584519.1 two-component sensor histidine kinase [Methylocystis sp.]MCA3588549.1 two-component sensor histidine kinase [Methylocystis sp.]MCA3591382.1 two-component sensor histidine kinase [Methylocystis sp.]